MKKERKKLSFKEDCSASLIYSHTKFLKRTLLGIKEFYNSNLEESFEALNVSCHIEVNFFGSKCLFIQLSGGVT